MPRTVVIITAGLFVAGLVGYGVFSSRDRRAPATPAGGEAGRLAPAPDFSLEDYRGNAVVLSQFRGRPVVVNSWAAWCPFCREELKDFAAVQKEFGEKVVIVAVDRGETLAVAKCCTTKIALSGSSRGRCWRI